MARKSVTMLVTLKWEDDDGELGEPSDVKDWMEDYCSNDSSCDDYTVEVLNHEGWEGEDGKG